MVYDAPSAAVLSFADAVAAVVSSSSAAESVRAAESQESTNWRPTSNSTLQYTRRVAEPADGGSVKLFRETVDMVQPARHVRTTPRSTHEELHWMRMTN